MSVVALVSGGLDSALMSVLAVEEGLRVHPLFIDYGQRAAAREWAACEALHAKHGLPAPQHMALTGFGKLVRSGLTDPSRRVNEDAFMPGRNLMLLVAGAAYAHDVGARAVAIGLLDEADRLFPDQSSEFLKGAEQLIRLAMGAPISITAPLARFKKADVMTLASARDIDGTYSCHVGAEQPCGACVSCLERKRAMVADQGD